jgi:CubicO group peptidase (beta-lactamase class C family)
MTVRSLAAVAFLALGLSGEESTDLSLKEDPRVASALQLLEAWVDAQQAYEALPAVSMAVVHDQDILWSRGFGDAHLETRSPASSDTMYSICSISKVFTGVAVMQLRDRGKLSLDDPVEKHLPWFQIKETSTDSPPITLRGILTHSSGLPRESDYPYWTGPEFAFPTHEQIVERVSQQSTLYPADRYFQYSNLGLTLAGEIVASASGQDFDRYLRENVLDPLGLKDTRTEHLDEFRGGRLATGYSARRRDGTREVVPRYQVKGIGPAAGFTSTVLDLARFASWQLRLLEKGGEEVLGANTLREMHRVHWVDPDWKTTWGLGFSVWRGDEKTFVGHGGYCPGYQSHLLLSARDKVAAVFMTNTNGVDSGLYTRQAYEIVAPAVKRAVEGREAAKNADPSLERYAGRYERWLAGESYVLPWEDGLAVVSFPTEKPLESLEKLKYVGEHRFRRIRDDESLGEDILFEVGPDGQATRMWRHSNYSVRVR